MAHVDEEIAAQPEVLRRLLARADEFATLAHDLRGRFDAVSIAARGSSDNAARYAQSLFGAHHHVPVALATPSVVTRHGARLRLSRTLLIGISQSGASPDVAAFVARTSTPGVPSVAVTNDPSSLLASSADLVLPLGVGPERAVAATGTYVATLMALALLSAHLSPDPDTRLADLAGVPDAVDATLRVPLPEDTLHDWVRARRGLVVGRGHEFATAHEVALKVQELGGIIAQAHSAADLRHGPMAAAGPDVPAIVVATRDVVADDALAAVELLRGRGSVVTAIGDAEDAAAAATHGIVTPSLPPWVMPMVTVVVGQRFAVALARHLERDVDQPDGLRKVTRTL